jgi:putative membrane protein
MKKIMFFFVIAGLATNIAKAQAPDPDTTARHFIIMASIGNLLEISSGRLAAQKAIRPDIKSFGNMMVSDHTQTQQKLMQLSKNKGYQIPPEATGGVMADLKLKNATDAFDRLYVHAMVVDHRSTVQMFEKYALTGKDPDVKAFAQQTLPTLKQHLAEITAIDKQIIKEVAK